MKSFSEDGPSYNWEHPKGESVSEFFGINIKTLDDGGFQFFKMDLSANYWKPQGWSILMGFQQPPMLRHLMGQMIMVLRIKEIGPTHMLLL